jgi:hypothetical protein
MVKDFPRHDLLAEHLQGSAPSVGQRMLVNRPKGPTLVIFL